MKKITGITMRKEYMCPLVLGVAVLPEDTLTAATTLGQGDQSDEDAPTDAETKENVWDQVWDREPVFTTE